MKQSNKKCIRCDVPLTEDNWYVSAKKQHIYKCSPCSREVANTVRNPIGNPQRMYVNGKYIPKSHQLYKAGNFKTFSDAAFESLAGYATTPEGEVYIIVNPAWEGWIKIGMAIEAEDRLRGYQTSSPLRDFKLKFKKYFDNRRIAEQQAHTLCAKKAIKRKGEWFQIDLKIAKDIINNMEIV
jgi:hypothetical protein